MKLPTMASQSSYSKIQACDLAFLGNHLVPLPTPKVFKLHGSSLTSLNTWSSFLSQDFYTAENPENSVPSVQIFSSTHATTPNTTFVMSNTIVTFSKKFQCPGSYC